MSAIDNSASPEVRLEAKNQVVNQINRLFQQFKERLTLDNLRLGERYVKGDLRLIFHSRLADKDYVAIFERFSKLGKLNLWTLYPG